MPSGTVQRKILETGTEMLVIPVEDIQQDVPFPETKDSIATQRQSKLRKDSIVYGSSYVDLALTLL